jgi:catechol 2,3-dioxygenase-like lactoylglutathione lyase family enzyme
MLRFDHLVIAARDLEAASADFHRLGFDVRPGGRHVGFGTRNAIVRFGLDYLELITVDDEQLALRTSRGALVEFLRDHEIGLCAYALATDDLDSLAHLAHESGIEMNGPFSMQRRRPDGSLLTWRLLVPDGNQYFKPWPFFIQWDLPDVERLALEPRGAHPNGAIGVASLEVATHDLRAAGNWTNALGLEPADIRMQLVKITAGHSEGPCSLTLGVRDVEETRSWLTSRGLPVRTSSTLPLAVRIHGGSLPGAFGFTAS